MASDQEARRVAVVEAALAYYTAFEDRDGRPEDLELNELKARTRLLEAVAALLELEAGGR